jgi:glycosidase
MVAGASNPMPALAPTSSTPRSAAQRMRRAALAACNEPRIAIERLTPSVAPQGGRSFVAKRVCGDTVEVEADIVCDGHETLAANVVWRYAGDTQWRSAPMHALHNDRWQARIVLDRMGRVEYTVEAWVDEWASHMNGLRKKFTAGVDVTLELEEARLELLSMAELVAGDDELHTALLRIAQQVGTPEKFEATGWTPSGGPPKAAAKSPARAAAAAASRATTRATATAGTAATAAPALPVSLAGEVSRPAADERRDAAADQARSGNGSGAATAARGEVDTASAGEALSRAGNGSGWTRGNGSSPAHGETRMDLASQVDLLLAPSTAALVARAGKRPFLSRHEPAMPIDVERPEAGFASWYELFPRSQTDDPARHGTFDDVIARLPAIAAMGFDVLYFPPIHPIGRINRKGRNNSLKAQEGDPGSPYAIGSEEGGHEAIHPQLGTLEDFERLRVAAAEHGMELALDFAIQCAPDHPWLKEHPEWFDWRPDGTIKYAENPPKKYEDIVNVDFYAPGAMPSLWIALRDIVALWVARGVRIFRVDNPHTKPLPFWEWLIADIRGRHPDVIFLAEAFTRPKMMYRLAKVGFSQSYTYFTWRNHKAELAEYLTELTTTEAKEVYRPHFFVNTPDINPYFLQTSGRPGFLIRAALATTLSGLWGMVAGYELCEYEAVKGKEEYLDSEKYQIKPRDWNKAHNIIAEITQLNRIRRANPALHSHLGVRFYNAWNDNILYYGKATRTPDGKGFDNFILVMVNLDPHHVQEAHFEVPLWEFGLPDHASIEAEDLMRPHRWTWYGKVQHVRLDPHDLPFAVWRLIPPGSQGSSP